MYPHLPKQKQKRAGGVFDSPDSKGGQRLRGEKGKRILSVKTCSYRAAAGHMVAAFSFVGKKLLKKSENYNRIEEVIDNYGGCLC